MTIWLAIGFGAYMTAAGIGGFLNPARWSHMMDELARSPTLQFLSAVVTFFLGFAILLVHPGGASPVSIAVSVIGWIEVVEGLLLFILGRPIFEIGGKIAALGRPVYAAIIALGGALITLAAAHF